MPKQKPQNKRRNADNNRFYTQLIVYRNRQWGIAFFVALATVVFGYFIAKDMFGGKSWVAIGTPLSLLGLLFLLIPPTEEWEYRPWQAKAQQYEKHFLD